MPNSTIDEFASVLVRRVRDAAIESSDSRLKMDARNLIADRWKKLIGENNAEALIEGMIPDIVDNTLFFLLHAIDLGELRLSFTDSAGRTVDLSEEGLGELAGWFIGSEGWRAQYSTQRFIDDFSDLDPT
jgi:hypothetical protein